MAILSLLTASNETIDIAAIYGPSDKDDPAFFEQVSDKLDNHGYKHRIIIGGGQKNKKSNFELAN